nr:hypothetical protein [uncultured Cohaesibacter sp.]
MSCKSVLRFMQAFARPDSQRMASILFIMFYDGKYLAGIVHKKRLIPSSGFADLGKARDIRVHFGPFYRSLLSDHRYVTDKMHSGDSSLAEFAQFRLILKPNFTQIKARNRK